ncbi:GNAT family N-acetyltransferase [soil metagenome]
MELQWLTAPVMVTPDIRTALTTCWRDVSNAGGAVGFPFPPVEEEDVRLAVEAMAESLDPDLNGLLVATVNGQLAGWLLLTGNRTRLTRHWAKVLRVQTALPHRGTGVGAGLMEEVARAARQDYGLEALLLEVRGGMGLEGFYQRCGWRVVGRWPGVLRMAPGDDRDEVMMLLDLVDD